MPKKVRAATPADAEDPAAEGLDGVTIEPVEDRIDPSAARGKAVLDGAPDEPQVHDPRWTKYVLGRLSGEELWDGHPTVPGLRRVAAELLGDIVRNDADPVPTPANATGLWATVKATIEILWRKGVPDGDTLSVRTFTGLADGNVENLETEFQRFASPTTETRAEGRALRKALHISVVTKEELTEVEIPEVRPDGRIDPANKNFIELKCMQCGMSVPKYIASWDKKYATLDDIPYGAAQKMVKHLSELQRDRKRIPEELKGYDPEWQKQEND